MNKAIKTIALCLLLLPTLLCAQKYTPDFESLDQHPTPRWFAEAKFGIYIDWGLYSVPAFSNYNEIEGFSSTEWYAPEVMSKPWRNDNFHINTYGEDFTYRDFPSLFKAELWNPLDWATLFQKSGAKYVIFPAKSHDGYCLWPTKDPSSDDWNSGENGPLKDMVGEMANACRRMGLKYGVSYSLLEWETTKTNWPFDEKYALERTGTYLPHSIWEKQHLEDGAFIGHTQIHLEELIKNYSPDLLYSYGEWDMPDSLWQSKEMLAWIYNNAPNKRSILVNDRWGNNTRGLWGNYYTTDKISPSFAKSASWENMQTIGSSKGYNRQAKIEDYKSSNELIESLCRTICNGGNYLLSIGPDANGLIPLLQQQRLLDIGRWLKVNAKAIYKTKPLQFHSDKYTFTQSGNQVFIFLYEWTQGSIKIELPLDMQVKNCKLLGHDKKIVWKKQGPGMFLIPPVLSPDNENIRHVYVFQLDIIPEEK